MTGEHPLHAAYPNHQRLRRDASRVETWTRTAVDNSILNTNTVIDGTPPSILLYSKA